MPTLSSLSSSFLLVALTATLARAEPLAPDRIEVIKPERNAETAQHTPGRPAWCEAKYTGDYWDADRLRRATMNRASWDPGAQWVQLVEHLCQWADDPGWQRQATYVVQAGMNADTDKDQAEVIERMKRLIVAAKKYREKESREPTDEDRFAFDDMHLTPVAPEPNTATAKITGTVPWCDAAGKIAEKWEAGRIARNGYGFEGVPESALHICQRPNDATWKQKATYLLQAWMNTTGQPQADAIASIRARMNPDKLEAAQKELCPKLVPSVEASGPDAAFAPAIQKFFGCHDRRYGETWQGQQNYQGDVTGTWLDSGLATSEIGRLHTLFVATEPARLNLPTQEADKNRALLLYAVVANDFATIDDKALDAELAKPPFSNNAYARAVVSESVGVLRRRKARYDEAIAKMVGDAGYAAILRDATKTAYADFAKLREEWKAEAAILDTLAKNISRGEEQKSAGCSKDLRHVMPKLLASYKTTNYQELRERLADDPARGYLLHGVALCFAIDKVPGAGALYELAGKGRSFRGPRRLAYFAVLDALQDVRTKRPNLPLDTTNFWNYNGSTYGGTLKFAGGLPAEKTESTGVIGKVTKSGSSVRVDFKKVVYSSPELFCKDTKKIVQITAGGGVVYERECQRTGKMSKIDETPPSVTVPTELATKLAPGMFAVIDTDGTVLFVKKKSDAETVEAFLGYAL